MPSTKALALRIYTYFERAIVFVLLALPMVMVLWSTWMLAAEIVQRTVGRFKGGPPISPDELNRFFARFGLLHEVFGAFLLILIGLELMKTVVAYLDQHELHVEVVFTVAMIAIARHAIGLDIETTAPLTLVGMGVLVLALSGGYYLFKKTTRPEAGP